MIKIEGGMQVGRYETLVGLGEAKEGGVKRRKVRWLSKRNPGRPNEGKMDEANEKSVFYPSLYV